jgi:hypothetical protein
VAEPETANASPSGLTARAGALLQRVEESARRGRDLIGDVCELAALEARLAALSLMEMQGLALIAALLAFTTWGLLLAALVLALVEWAGLGWVGALLVLAAMNAAAGAWVWLRLRRLSDNLTFNATRALLLPATPTPHEDGDGQRQPTAT